MREYGWMRHPQRAAQLYTVRDFLRTPADIATSLQRIADLDTCESLRISYDYITSRLCEPPP